jgi:REP element-mobilizing transposase RayT
MRQQEAFSGVRVLTWACLSNHFHVLVAVEDKDGERALAVKERLLADDGAFLRRLRHLYEPKALEEIGKQLKLIRKGGAAREEKEKQVARLKQPYLDRMYDLSSFVGEIKQRLSQWYNLRNGRKGPLWEERFRSVLLEGEAGLLAMVAAYIDLNAVRAGLVKDPRDWRWCGYAEATAAQSRAREGICEALGEAGEAGEASREGASREGAGWRRAHQRYREILMHEGVQRRDEEGRVVRKGLTPGELEAEEARGFELPRAALLHQRIRYFTEGLALGSAEFIEGVFRKRKRILNVKRKVGPRVPRMEGLGDLRTLRDLRKAQPAS